MTREIGRFEINCWFSRHAEKWARFEFGVTKKLPKAELNYFFDYVRRHIPLNYFRKVTRAHPKMMSKLEGTEGWRVGRRWGRGRVFLTSFMVA